MKPQLPGWDKLNEYAKEYHAEVQKGFGTEVKYDKRIEKWSDNRSDYQKELADKIINGALPYFYQLAENLLAGNAVRLYRDGPKISLKRYKDIIPIDDLIQESVIRVIRCLHNHDPAKGRVSTFLTLNIVSGMWFYAVQKSGIIRLPEHVVGKLRTEDYENLSISKIAAKMNVKLPVAGAVYLGMTNRYVNIDSPPKINKKIDNYESFSWNIKIEDIIADENAQTDKQICRNELEKKVRRALATLTLREEKVLQRRFGIGDDNDQTLEAIGQEEHVTKERIRNIEAKALRQLRHPSRAKYLNEFVE